VNSCLYCCTPGVEKSVKKGNGNAAAGSEESVGFGARRPRFLLTDRLSMGEKSGKKLRTDTVPFKGAQKGVEEHREDCRMLRSFVKIGSKKKRSSRGILVSVTIASEGRAGSDSSTLWGKGRKGGPNLRVTTNGLSRKHNGKAGKNIYIPLRRKHRKEHLVLSPTHHDR